MQTRMAPNLDFVDPVLVRQTQAPTLRHDLACQDVSLLRSEGKGHRKLSPARAEALIPERTMTTSTSGSSIRLCFFPRAPFTNRTVAVQLFFSFQDVDIIVSGLQAHLYICCLGSGENDENYTIVCPLGGDGLSLHLLLCRR